MILINDDQCNVADIVLDVWLFEKKSITLVYIRDVVMVFEFWRQDK